MYSDQQSRCAVNDMCAFFFSLQTAALSCFAAQRYATQGKTWNEYQS